MQQSSLGPGDIANLYQCLQGALSPDVNVQKAAEETLKSLEDRQGFCSCLAVRHLLQWLTASGRSSQLTPTHH